MAAEYDKSGFSSEDIKRYALTKDPSTISVMDSENHGRDLGTGSDGIRDAPLDSAAANHSPSAGNLSSGGGAETVAGMEPLTENSYGGGLYGKDNTPTPQHTGHASDFQSAEGQASDMPDRKGIHEPPSSGDRATDIIGISYIQ